MGFWVFGGVKSENDLLIINNIRVSAYNERIQFYAKKRRIVVCLNCTNIKTAVSLNKLIIKIIDAYRSVNSGNKKTCPHFLVNEALNG